MKMSQALKIFVVVGFVLVWINPVQAGFGVSPPWVIAEHLLEGSHFEQTIYLVQGRPEQDLIAKITIDDSAVKDWISIDQGMEFKIPAGVQQFPIKVIVDVPKGTALGDYEGSLRVQASAESLEQGVINIALGALIELKLRVTEEEFLNFIVRSAKIKPIETGWPVKIYFSVENTGNIQGRPTKATLEVWNINMSKLLESGQFADFDYVEPFETEGLVAEFVSDLAIGEYWGVFKLEYNDVVLRQDKAVFNVLEQGSLSGWRGIVRNIGAWFTWLRTLYLIIGLAALITLAWLKRRFKIKIINVLMIPVRIFKRLLKIRISFKE